MAGPEAAFRYNRLVPAAQLSIMVRLQDMAALNLLDGFTQQGRTVIGTDLMFSLKSTAGPDAQGLLRHLGGLGIPFEGHAQVDGRDYLVAGDGKQTSIVEAWAPTPVGMAAPPLRHDGSMDLIRRRQWEWHCGFLDIVRARMNHPQTRKALEGHT
jgi:hypothetical protein